MKPKHATHTTGAQRPWMEVGVVALVRRTIERMGLALLTSATRPAQAAGMSPGSARRIEPPLFADTEAGWHHL